MRPALADLSVLDIRGHFLHPDDLPALDEQRRNELAAGAPFGGEVRVRDSVRSFPPIVA